MEGFHIIVDKDPLVKKTHFIYNGEYFKRKFMEISKINTTSIKIKTKNTTFLVDPASKSEGDVVLLMQKGDFLIPEEAKLIVEGPGEYEVAGVSIKGVEGSSGMIYRVFDDQYNILIITSDELAKRKDEDEYDGVFIKVTEKIDEAILSNCVADAVVLYGEEGNLPLPKEETKVMSRVNLKKKEEVKGVVFLSN